MNNIFKVITPDGRALWFGFTRHDGDKELFEANESARLYKDGEVIADNFDVFPLESEGKSAWIPVGERLPERETELCSVDVLFTDGEEYHIGYHMQDPPSNQDPNPRQSWWSDLKRSTIPDVTHWQELPALP